MTRRRWRINTNDYPVSCGNTALNLLGQCSCKVMTLSVKLIKKFQSAKRANAQKSLIIRECMRTLVGNPNITLAILRRDILRITGIIAQLTTQAMDNKIDAAIRNIGRQTRHIIKQPIARKGNPPIFSSEFG